MAQEDSLWRKVIGQPRDVMHPDTFHRVSLAAFLAWVGLGADGLSSSAYGPEEGFRALGEHGHLAPLLALMTAATIAIISLAYSNMIEHFPGGGGGYLVATKLLGSSAGVVSGSALLVDYVLTITISVSSGCDQLFSFLPASWLAAKLLLAFGVLATLLVLNLRGVRESVTVLAPLFVGFLVTHAVLLGWGLFSHVGELPRLAADTTDALRESSRSLGWGGVALILLRAYSLGGGTYTGIEAVSNGVGSLREPRVTTARRTMLLMAVSLALTAGGILVCYQLMNVSPEQGRTLNAVLFDRIAGDWSVGGVGVGRALVIAALVAEAVLLFVAAQAGFLDGPRVLANMSLDSWMPHRFAQLSDRLVAQHGVIVMALAAGVLLLYTRGDVATLVVMYAINVFITFSLSLLGMSRYSWGARRTEPHWRRRLALHVVGFVTCSGILCVIVFEKLREGAWITLVITAGVILTCRWVRAHYEKVRGELRRLDDALVSVPVPRGAAVEPAPLDASQPTAIICVASYSGFGLHQILSIQRSFPGFFKNYVFVSVAVVDSGRFKGLEEVGHLQAAVEADLDRYVEWMRAHGFQAERELVIGTEAVASAEAACTALARRFPRSVVFMGKLIFERERWHHRLLHNETALAIQRRLQFQGVQAVVLPIRVMEA